MSTSFKTPSLHLVETAPSVLRKMPSVVLKERGGNLERVAGGERREGKGYTEEKWIGIGGGGD